MAIRFYNTLTRELQTFEPLEPGKAKVYVCGLTTYDYAHAGHARTNASFDVLVRHLRARGYDVTFVRNVTDVDDKIVSRAAELGEEPLSLSKRFSALADDDLAAIGCAKPDVEPRVSTHIGEIVRFVERLVERGAAYVADGPKGKDVYFRVRKFEGYCKLSKRNLDDLRAGARVEKSEIKEDPLDFALWKGCEGDAFGWDSPWGKGRPGWHIECSAMAHAHLGEHIDIHAGGMDLIFPHHENEIAQSEALFGADFSRYWLHGGFLNVDKEKMSKSLGNFVTIRDVLERNDAEALRYFLLGTHYRGPLSFDVEKAEDGRVTFPGVDDAERRVEYLYATRDALREASAGAEPAADGTTAHDAVIREAREKAASALDQDLNTPVALAVVAELAKAGNELVMQLPKKRKDPKALAATQALAAAGVEALEAVTATLGLLQSESEAFWARTRERRLRLRSLDAAVVDGKVAARRAARDAKDFAQADALRDELVAMGVELHDGPTATRWRVTL